MDAQKINDMLHNDRIAQHYTARIGETVQIALPAIPLTRHTEYLRLTREVRGNRRCFVEESPGQSGEGTLQPTRIQGRAVKAGKVHFVVRAVDSLSGDEIPNVKPLDILLEVRKE